MNVIRRYFISCASAEFRSYREDLRKQLTSSIAEVKVQEDFANGPATLLEKLDDYILQASAVLHLVGKWGGSVATPAEVRAVLKRYPDFATELPELKDAVVPDSCPFTYTQWECFLATYHKIPCFIYLADDSSAREPGWVENAAETRVQDAHRARLSNLGKDQVMLPFADAREVALSFYKAFDSQVSGVTFQQSVPRSVPTAWPAASLSHPYSLADREPEFDLFLKLISGQSKERILLIHGPSDRGKSSLMAAFEDQARALQGLVCGRVEFKGTPSLREVLFNLSQDLQGVRFARFERELQKTSEEPLRLAFLQDLSESHTPVVLLLDTYEEASEEARKWVEGSLFGLVRRFDGLRLVVCGQEVPQQSASAPWSSMAVSRELPPIMDHSPWCRYLRDVLGVTQFTEDQVKFLVLAAQGSPRPLGALLANLRNVC